MSPEQAAGEHDIDARADLAIHYHDDSLETDVLRLRNSKILPESVTVSGYLYHHSSGTLTEVHPSD